MGEVYRATDTKLKRDVAIKVLPATFVEDRERLARFEREAQLLAQLHHPNIASIFGLEESGGTKALVMELVEGPTLAERLEQGSLPLDESLSLARQIAEALEEAHEKGIIHRDLKPQNIKASIEGKVKVLDFGLAKAMDPVGAASGDPGSASQLAHSPTLTMGATVQGMILGTAAYMAPEQAKGLATDKRADIWAFGVVLYEMLVGGTLFGGDTVGDTLAAVIRAEIDLDRLPPGTPAALHRLLRRCLERNPKNRLHDIADARILLDEVLAGEADEPGRPQAEPAARASRSMAPSLAAAAGVAAGVLLALASTGWLSTSRGESSSSQRLVSNLAPPEGYTFSAVDGGPELSRDGRRLAFLASRTGEPVYLFVRALDSADARRIDVPGAQLPFFSPDGRSLGFFAGGKLKRLDIASWKVVDLADAPEPAGGSWSQDGRILFIPDSQRPPVVINNNGSELRQLPEPFPHLFEAFYYWCELLPDGRHFLFTLQDLAGSAHSGLFVTSLDGNETPKKLTRTISRPRFLAPGWLLFSLGPRLDAWPFDPDTLTLGEKPTRIVDGVAWGRFFAHGRFAVSATGLLVYHPGTATAGDTQLVTTDRAGKVLGVPGELAEYYSPRLSHDGRRIAVDRTDVQTTFGDIWVLDGERGTRTRLSNSPADESDPQWLPGDGEIVFHSGPDLFLRDASAATATRTLLASDAAKAPRDVSPDGRYLLFEVRNAAGADLWLLDLGSGTARPWLNDESFDENNARFSPDGRWVAYQTDETGEAEVVLRSFPDGRERIPVSTTGGQEPVWRADGSELFFLSPGSEITAVPIAWQAGRPRPGTPKTLFHARLREGVGNTQYDVYPDGQRFLLNRLVVKADDRPMVLVQHWDATLAAAHRP